LLLAENLLAAKAQVLKEYVNELQHNHQVVANLAEPWHCPCILSCGRLNYVKTLIGKNICCKFYSWNGCLCFWAKLDVKAQAIIAKYDTKKHAGADDTCSYNTNKIRKLCNKVILLVTWKWLCFLTRHFKPFSWVFYSFIYITTANRDTGWNHILLWL